MRVRAPEGLELCDEERIEDRLENLKLLPSWKEVFETTDFGFSSGEEWALNEEEDDSNSDSSDSDSEEEDDQEKKQEIEEKDVSWLHAVFWTPIGLLCMPLLLVLSCCTRSK